MYTLYCSSFNASYTAILAINFHHDEITLTLTCTPVSHVTHTPGPSRNDNGNQRNDTDFGHPLDGRWSQYPIASSSATAAATTTPNHPFNLRPTFPSSPSSQHLRETGRYSVLERPLNSSHSCQHHLAGHASRLNDMEHVGCPLFPPHPLPNRDPSPDARRSRP